MFRHFLGSHPARPRAIRGGRGGLAGRPGAGVARLLYYPTEIVRYFSQTRRHEAIDYVGLYRVLCRLARSWEHRSAELGELRAAQVGIVAATRE